MAARIVISVVIGLAMAPAAHAVSWSAPASLLPKLEGSRFQLAVNARGEQVFVWEQQRTPQLATVGARLRSASGRFGPVQELRRSVRAITPDVAIAPDGTAIAAWNRVYRGHLRIFAAVRRPGHGFGRAALIGRTDKAQGAQPQVEFDRRGNAIVLWRWSDRLQWSFRARGHQFGRARSIILGSRTRPAAIDEKFLAFDRRGTAYVAVAAHGSRRGVFLTRRGRNGLFGGARRLSPPGEPASQPRLAIAGDGTVTAIWRAAEATGTEQEAGRIEGAVISGRRVRSFQRISLVAGTDPQVGVGPSGEAVTVWQQFHAGAATGVPFWQEVAASVRPAGGLFGAPVTLSPAMVGAERAAVVVTDAGDAVVIWEQPGTVVSVTRSAGGAFSPPHEIGRAEVSFVAGAGRHIVVLLVTTAGVQVVTGVG